jgi:putative CocE/NonD family hydrolase
VLSFASDAPSADVVARLADVAPCGRSINVADGNVRLRTAGGVVRGVELDLSPTGVRFERGHRIRLDVMGSSFPLLDRNPHTGGSAAGARRADLRVATHFVFHDADRPSVLELPVVDA